MNRNTRLFTINLWQAQVYDDPTASEWRGKLQSLPDGEAYYFREWTVLIQHLEHMLCEREENPSQTRKKNDLIIG